MAKRIFREKGGDELGITNYELRMMGKREWAKREGGKRLKANGKRARKRNKG